MKIKRKKERIVLHPVCSLQHMGLENKFAAAASQLAEETVIPRQAGCCGMAGDRGFLFPELTRSAPAAEAAAVRQQESSTDERSVGKEWVSTCRSRWTTE